MQHFIRRRTSKLYASKNDVIVMRNTSAGDRSSASALWKNSFAAPPAGALFESTVRSGAGVGDAPGTQLPPQQDSRPRYCSIKARARGRLKVMPFARMSRWLRASMNRVNGTTSPPARYAYVRLWQLG